MTLQMLDMIVSYKEPSGLLPTLADKAILRYQHKLYPNGNVNFNHVRVYIGEYTCVGHAAKIPLVFEWTSPVSRIMPLRMWMLDPEYSWVMRHNAIKLEEGAFPSHRVSRAERWSKDFPDWRSSPNGKIYPVPLLEYCLDRAGKLYDYLQLAGIGLGIKCLQMGSNHEVCSTGARELFEDVTGVKLFGDMPLWRTPPAAFANDREWRRVT